MSTLKIELRENIEINANNYGSYNEISIPGINEVSKRIVTVPTTEQEIISMSTTIGSGTYLESDVRYIRITNLSTSQPVVLTFKNENNDEFAVKLDKGLSYIYSGISGSGVIDSMTATGSSAIGLGPGDANPKDLVSITAQSSGSTSSDIEYFIAAI